MLVRYAKSSAWSRAARLILCTGLVSSVLAHDPGLSTATVRVEHARLEAVVVMSIRDAASLVEMSRKTNYTSRFSSSKLDEAAFSLIAGQSVTFSADQEVLQLREVACSSDSSGNVMVRLVAPLGACSQLTVRSALPALLPAGHRQFLSIRDARDNLLSEKLLSATDDSATVTVAASNTGPAARTSPAPATGFFSLGVKHILTGFDHLLFLFSLLVVSQTLTSTLKIITSFTVAHSLTLALAAYGAIEVPGSVVEPLIAASIVYVAVENLVRGKAAQGRSLLTFAFGLVHGLGFASALRELGISSTSGGMLKPLLGFNLGVELGQLAVAALLLPLFWKVNGQPVLAKRLVPVCSALVALAGCYWFIQRTCFS